MSKSGGRIGRPPKEITPELQQRIIARILDAAPGAVAAQAEGISDRLYYQWKAKGEADPDSVFGEFLHAVKTAEAQFQCEAQSRIKTGVEGWTSLAWLLERRCPERYGRRKPLELKQAKLEIEVLRAKLALLQQGQNPDGQPLQVVVRKFEDDKDE